MKTNFSGYVLAGGKSSRMRTDKAFLEIKGETFLSRAVKTLETVCADPVKIVFNQTQTKFIEKIPDRIPSIFDCYENRGALGGIHAALTDCPSEWAIVLAVDLPRVTNEAIENLMSIARSSKNFAAIVPVQSDGKLQPLCAVYRAEDCLPKLEILLKKTASAAVKDFLKLIPTRFVGQGELPTKTGEDLFFNVNRPADFQLFLSKTE